jgi:microcystin-dependent protein
MGDGVGWHTPVIDTGTFVIRSAKVPVSLLSHVGGALGMLSESYNWLEIGDPVEDIIALVQDMIDSWYTQEMIGAVIAFAGTIPPGYQALDGSSLDGDLYPELAAVVPSAWIAPITGDILLPDMTGRGIVGYGTNYDTGDTGGEDEHTLTAAEMPSHTHNYIPPVINVDIEAPGVPDPVAAGLGPTTATSAAGDGDPHNNMPPYLVLQWAIFTGREYV